MAKFIHELFIFIKVHVLFEIQLVALKEVILWLSYWLIPLSSSFKFLLLIINCNSFALILSWLLPSHLKISLCLKNVIVNKLGTYLYNFTPFLLVSCIQMSNDDCFLILLRELVEFSAQFLKRNCCFINGMVLEKALYF